MGSDGIAISGDGSRLFDCPLASSRLYSAATAILADRSHDEAAAVATVVDEGDRGGAADGLESDADGDVYATNYEHNAIPRSALIPSPSSVEPGEGRVDRDHEIQTGMAHNDAKLKPSHTAAGEGRVRARAGNCIHHSWPVLSLSVRRERGCQEPGSV
jgi:hypothetical protein